MDDSSRRSSREGYLADWHPKYPNRTTDFERRAALYASYDAQLFEYTRFFAAASIINAVLAKLFATVPASRSQRCFGFLTEVGAALETTNHVYAGALARLFYILRDVRAQVGGDLDFASEFHRILIGMKIIEYIRRDDGGAVIAKRVVHETSSGRPAYRITV
jgi:hypothetical protein